MEQQQKRPRGRPPGLEYPERLTVRLTAEIRDQLRRLAEAQGTTEAVMARRLIEAVCEARDRG